MHLSSVDMAKRYVERTRTGARSFKYFHGGRQVSGKDELSYFKSLGIPPAWKDVRIAVSHNAKIVATGVDKAGRLQYVYEWTLAPGESREGQFLSPYAPVADARRAPHQLPGGHN